MTYDDTYTLTILAVTLTVGGFLMMLGSGYGVLFSVGAVPFLFFGTVIALLLIRALMLRLNGSDGGQ